MNLTRRSEGRPIRRQKLPVGQKIRERRLAMGLTQADLAGRIGIQQSDLCRMEKGEYRVSLETLFKVLRIFQVNIGDFFAEEDPFVGDSSEELARLFRGLSPTARKEVLDFVRFKSEKSD
jgi:transcriptional regulator with XRE-family HTH domain